MCHGVKPIGGAPMSLVSYEDLHRPAPTQPNLKVYELSQQRLNDQARPMPPGSMIAEADWRELDDWFSAGATASEEAATCQPMMPQPMDTLEPLTALPGETCYEFRVDGASDTIDDTPYTIPRGEHYASFYFKAPWPNDTVATRFGGRYENAQVLHHWLMYETSENQPEGRQTVAATPTVNGVNAVLLGGWALGRPTMTLPADVGQQLPPQGTQLNIQWHFFNTTDQTQTTRASVQLCTVPASERPHAASITWIGTEDLNGTKYTGGPGMPPRQRSSFTATCDPARRGMSPTEPIHIVAVWPHMHQLGRRMEATVNHRDGTQSVIFDKPFDFNHQFHYMLAYDLAAGDTLSVKCSYENTTDRGVAFGESSEDEMCFLYTYAWPAHALDNNAFSLIGSTDTCW